MVSLEVSEGIDGAANHVRRELPFAFQLVVCNSSYRLVTRYMQQMYSCHIIYIRLQMAPIG